MARHKRRSRWTRQASLEALVRFGPEQSGLRAAKREAKSLFRTTVRQADATSAGIKSAIKQTRPEVIHDYDAVGLQAARAAQVAEPDIAGAPASFRAAVAAERAGFTSRLGEARASQLTELGNRRVQATEGAQFAKQNAVRVLAGDLTKLLQRGQDLRRERGAFTALTARELRQAAQKEATATRLAEARIRTTQRGQNISKRGQDLSHADRVAQRKLSAKNGRAAVGKKGGQSPSKHFEVQQSIEELVNVASKYKGRPRHEIVGLLKTEKPKRTILVDRKGNPLPEGLSGQEKVKLGAQKVTIGGRKAFKPDLRMSAALDVALAGHLSKTTQRRLQAAGFSVRDLGLPTYGEWARKQRNRPRPRTTPRYKPVNAHASPKYGAH